MSRISQDLTALDPLLCGRVLRSVEDRGNVLVLSLGDACWLQAEQCVLLQGERVWSRSEPSEFVLAGLERLIGRSIQSVDSNRRGRFSVWFEGDLELLVLQQDEGEEWLQAQVGDAEFVASMDR